MPGTPRPGWQRLRHLGYRWLALELAAGLAALCVTISGVSMVISLLLTRDPATLLPVALGFIPASVWLAHESWPLVTEAWNGYPALG